MTGGRGSSQVSGRRGLARQVPERMEEARSKVEETEIDDHAGEHRQAQADPQDPAHGAGLRALAGLAGCSNLCDCLVIAMFSSYSAA